MNQILVFESSELTAFGIFNINLNLVISVSMFSSNCVLYCYICMLILNIFEYNI